MGYSQEKASAAGQRWGLMFRYLMGLALLALLPMGSQNAYGQGATGAINGVVTDPSGAVVPGATVTIKNVATQTAQVAQTNSDGRYVFPTLQPGSYSLSVSQKGFTTATETPFQLSVNQTSTHNISMQIGSASQQVTVEAASANLEASSAELGTAIQTQEVQTCPSTEGTSPNC